MKRRKALAMGLALAMATSVCGMSAYAEEFNPDKDPNGIDWTEMREQYGAMPEVADGLVIGGLVKQLQNEFWQSLKKGYEECGAYIAEQAGVELTVDV